MYGECKHRLLDVCCFIPHAGLKALTGGVEVGEVSLPLRRLSKMSQSE